MSVSAYEPQYVCLSVCLPMTRSMSVCLSVCLPMTRSMSVYLSVCL